MWKTARSLLVVALITIPVSGGFAADQPDFTLCKSTYALCTTAPCTLVAGQKDTVSCACDVKTGYSAGTEPCQGKVETAKGTQVRSRYYPVKSYAVCTNDRPWTWCLDKPCIIDKNDPTKAACACTSVKEEGNYVIVTSKYAASTCTTGIISSATVTQIDQVTDFLKKSSQLKPFGINVLSSPK